MPASALALALAAAALHAVWNLLLARARDVEAATAIAFAIAIALFVPVAMARWDVDREAAPYIAVSAAAELLYLVLLAAAYARAELSVVYPIARGLAPVLVLAVGISVLGVGTSAVEVSGVLFVGAGVLLVRGWRRGQARGAAFGAAIAACIAGYTLADARGVEHADPVAYLVVVMAVPVAAYFAIVVRRRGVAALKREFNPATLIAAPATSGAFVLVLFALQRASAASVAAVRETSVVIAVALAAPVLGERVTSRRLAGAVLVVLGVAVLGAGCSSTADGPAGASTPGPKFFRFPPTADWTERARCPGSDPCYPRLTTFHRFGEMGARRPFFVERPTMTDVYAKEKTLFREIAPQVEQAIPGVEVLALELSGPERFTVYIDHPQRVDHALCARVTDVLRPYLRQYTVDVSSPGIERPLRTPAHFERAVGRQVALRTSEDVKGRKRFKGSLVGTSPGGVRVSTDGDEYEIPYDAIVRGNLIEERV